ncbi:MAG: DUF1385 domain-containing protein, partial [Clostridia bacterium]|nr:DUF1385 domain-containing protein [Clostridia bacterium]
MAKREKKEKKQKPICSSVGGQAVIEGVMMVGKTAYCTAVRNPNGEIQVEKKRINRSPSTSRAMKVPFVRGIVNMVSSLVNGTNAIMRSAQVYGSDDDEPGRVEKWFAEKLKLNLSRVISAVSMVIGFALAIFLFLFLPRILVNVLDDNIWDGLKGSYLEYIMLGVFKLAIFLIYLGLVMILKDIRRLYRYHGAEHKTINCYERGLDLTTENVMSCSRIHDRCGTSFLFIVLIINIVIIGVVSYFIGVHHIVATEGGLSEAGAKALRTLANVGIEIVLLPVIAGISYEVLKLFAKIRGPIGVFFKWPG